MQSPHDRLFKLVFQQPVHAAGELSAILPAALLAMLDLSTLTLEPGTYVEPEGVELRSDLLFSVRTYNDHTLLAYLLFEHKSTQDPNVPLQVLGYDVAIWRAWRRDHPSGPLPPVMPIVLSHAKGGWRGPTTFQELFGPKVPEALRPYLPEFKLLIDDLKAHDDEEIQARPMRAVARLALLLLAHTRDDSNLLTSMARWPNEWREAWAAEVDHEVFAEIFEYIVQVSQDVTPAGLGDFARRTLGPDAEEVVMTAGQRLIEQGRLQGLEQGIEQGLEQGLEQGIEQGLEQGIEQGEAGALRRALLIMVRLKFRVVDEAVKRLVETAALEALRRWEVRIITANSVGEVFE